MKDDTAINTINTYSILEKIRLDITSSNCIKIMFENT
jgi:hypothetical protein